MSKIKIRCTIYLENCPQILIQLILLYIEGFQSDNQSEILLAMTASVLSIAATLLIHWGERDLRTQYVVSIYFIGLRIRQFGSMSNEEKAAMKNNMGLRKALGKRLAESLGIAEKQIEIGNVRKQENGVMIHVQHLVFANEFDHFREKLNQFNVTAEQYMHSVFRSKIARISAAVCSHFEISVERQGEYRVSYQRDMTDNESMVDVLSEDEEIDGVAAPKLSNAVSFSLGDCRRTAGTRSSVGSALRGRSSVVHTLGRIPSQSSAGKSGNVELEMVMKKRTTGGPYSAVEGSGDVDVAQMLSSMQQQLAHLSAVVAAQQSAAIDNGMITETEEEY